MHMHGLYAERQLGEAQIKTSYASKFPLQSIKPVEPRKHLKADISWLAY